MKSPTDIGDIWHQISIVIRANDHLQFWTFRTERQQPHHATSADIENFRDLLKVKKLEKPKKRKEAELRPNLEKDLTQEGDQDPERDQELLDPDQETDLRPEMRGRKSKHLDPLEKKQRLRCQKG